MGKIVVSDESGRKFGVVGDVSFITESGELMNLVLVEPTKHVSEVNIQEDERGRYLVPFSAVKAVGEFVIVSEKDIIWGVLSFFFFLIWIKYKAKIYIYLTLIFLWKNKVKESKKLHKGNYAARSRKL